MTTTGRSLTRRSLLLGGAVTAAAAALGASSVALVSGRRAASAENLPKYAYRSRQTTLAYRAALARRDLLAELPCYCGCDALLPPHQNLGGCYLRPDGDFEEHAAWCEVCQAETLDANRWADQGIALSEIRRRIDEQYRG